MPRKAPTQAVLTSAIVIQYAAINRRYADIKRDRDELNSKIKAALQGGESCPTDTPYLLVLGVQHRCTYSWKQITEMVLENLPSRVKVAAVRFVDRLQNEKKEVIELDVQVNPAYGKLLDSNKVGAA